MHIVKKQAVNIMIIHTVKQGDTIFSIAKQYGVSELLLVINNGISGIENDLPEGLSIVVLVPSKIHTVRKNETTRSIASRYGITVNDLYRKNLILEGLDIIFEGQTLVIEYDTLPIYDYDIGGYTYTYITQKTLNTSLPLMKIMMPFTYGFDENADLVYLDDDLLLTRAFHYRVKPCMHLSTLTTDGNFSNELSSKLLNSKQLWPILADNILSTMFEKNYACLDVDFEFLNATERFIYPQFISYLRDRLSPYSLPIIVALPPKTSNNQQGALYEGVDYALLGEAADKVLVMTYEWGYTFGPPMPVSPTPSIRKVLDYTVSVIPAEKVYMGISNYGYDWTLPYIRGVSKATSLSNIDAITLASSTRSQILYSEEYEAPYYFYTDEKASSHEVWFEDARSIAAKLSLISEYGLYGGLYWNITRPNPQNLAVLSSLLKYNN